MPNHGQMPHEVLAETMQEYASPCVTMLSVDELTPSFVRAWHKLEARALESNAFLSPNFILPSCRYLTPESSPVVLAVCGEPEDPESLIGLGVFEEVPATPSLPLRHLRAYDSIHTFMDGLLIDESHAVSAITSFFGFVRSNQTRWHGVHFAQIRTDSDQARLLVEIAEEQRCSVQTVREWERASILPSHVNPDYMKELYSPSRRKSFRRARNKLQRFGDVQFNVYRCGDDHENHCDTFLQLEAMGWKGDQQSALLSHELEECFFLDMSRRFSQTGRSVFIELEVGNETVFASSNFLSGSECFGFKSGWHTDYKSCSPGMLGELLTLSHAPSLLGDVDTMDSCSEPGKYIEDVWPWKRSLASRVFTTTRVAGHASTVTSKLLHLKRRLSGESTSSND